MYELVKTIGISVITNATVLGLFIWVFKESFKTSLVQRTKAFQAKIELLNKKNFYQYSKLYDEQAQNIDRAKLNLKSRDEYFNIRKFWY